MLTDLAHYDFLEGEELSLNILSLTSLLLQHLINLTMFINHRHLELMAIMTQS